MQDENTNAKILATVRNFTNVIVIWLCVRQKQVWKIAFGNIIMQLAF
jgi:hypothetical protein